MDNTVRGAISSSQMQAGQLAFIVLAYATAGFLVGLALVPAFALVLAAWQFSAGWPIALRLIGTGICAGWGYFLFGVALSCVTVLFCRIFCSPVREGDYPFFSVPAARWVFSYVFTLAVQVFFIHFMRSTPLICAWYRGMGAAIGDDVQINTPHLNDAALLEFEDGALVGAESVLICHGTEHGALILRKTYLGRGAAIGAGAVVMPGVRVGARAVVLPGSVVSPGTQIPSGEVWGGVPAQCLKTGAERSKAA